MISTSLRVFVLLQLSLCLMACASRPFSATQPIDRSGLLYGQVLSPTGLPRDRQFMIEQLDAQNRAIARQPVAIATDGSFHVIAAAPGRYRITVSARTDTRSDGSNLGDPVLLEPGELYFVGLFSAGPEGTIDWLAGEADDFALLAMVRSRIADATWQNRVDYELDQRER